MTTYGKSEYLALENELSKLLGAPDDRVGVWLISSPEEQQTMERKPWCRDWAVAGELMVLYSCKVNCESVDTGTNTGYVKVHCGDGAFKAHTEQHENSDSATRYAIVAAIVHMLKNR